MLYRGLNTLYFKKDKKESIKFVQKLCVTCSRRRSRALIVYIFLISINNRVDIAIRTKFAVYFLFTTAV